MAAILELADAVVAELNANVLDTPPPAIRSFAPTYELTDMGTLHVTVVPRSEASETLDRSRHDFRYELDVAVQKKLAGGDAEIDQLVELAQDVADYFRGRRPTGYPGAMCVGAKIQPIVAAEHLLEFGQFTSIVTLTFRVAR